MKPVVHLVDQSRYDTEEIRAKVGRAMHQDGFDPRGKTVFVKPSFVYPARPPRQGGVNTQPEVVAGVVRALRDLGACRVWVGEDCLVGASQTSFVAMGVLPLLRGQARPLYLKDEDRVTVEVSRPLVEKRFFLPRKFVEADLFVSLPKLKVNMHAAITLSVKNHIVIYDASADKGRNNATIRSKTPPPGTRSAFDSLGDGRPPAVGFPVGPG